MLELGATLELDFSAMAARVIAQYTSPAYDSEYTGWTIGGGALPLEFAALGVPRCPPRHDNAYLCEQG